jgi:hypothetical protein
MRARVIAGRVLPMRTPLLLSLAVAAALAVPAAASADSIVYIDGGNVFSAKPDGSAKVQLTDGGHWHSPTQADDGTIAAVDGTGPIQVMARDGRPLRTITTQPAKSGDGGTFAPRPVQLSFSPDASKIAYSYVANSCPVASTCGTIQRSTFYTAATVTDATPQGVYGNQFGVSDPEWVTNNRTLVFGGAGSQVSIDDLGPGDYSFKPWMTPNVDMGDGEVTRDGKRLAATFDYGENLMIAFFAVNGDVKTETPPAAPDAACNTGKDPGLADPSWSPDGSGVAFQSSEGVEVIRFSELSDNHCAAAPGYTLAPGASSPDWGPADPTAARYVAPPAPAPAVPATTATPIPPVAKPAPKPGAKGGTSSLVFTVVGGSKPSRAALRKGLVVKVSAPGAGKVSVKLTAKGKRVAVGSAKATKAGAVSVRLGKVGARAAKALRGKTIRLTISAGGQTATRTLKVG